MDMEHGWFDIGETDVLGEKHYTASVVDEWMSMEHCWNDTDRGNWSNRRDLSKYTTLFSKFEHIQTRHRTWAYVSGRRLTAWAIALPGGFIDRLSDCQHMCICTVQPSVSNKWEVWRPQLRFSAPNDCCWISDRPHAHASRWLPWGRGGVGGGRGWALAVQYIYLSLSLWPTRSLSRSLSLSLSLSLDCNKSIPRQLARRAARQHHTAMNADPQLRQLPFITAL